ncbi:methylcobamide:CoM methyltransferase MtbA [Terrisporobacter vanillatitrophus]|uniref:methylcobamide:CoM methyltransferase MtbA n=1 Tax=Terrisporobacter vanillatitrophus TaxID=3058402 RepID=UPI003366FD5D
MITSKERLKKVFNKEVVDRPPCICPGGMMNMITTQLMDKSNIFWPNAHLNGEKMASLAIANYENGCFENYGVPFCMTIEAEALGAKVTLGTKEYEPHVTEYAIESVSEYKKLKPMNLNEGREKVVLDAIKILKEKNENVPIVGNITGPISTASSLMEPVDFYKELRKKNKEAHEFMNFVTEEIIKFARAQIDAGADVIAISDPSGSGEILGPKDFEQFVVKYINQIIDGLQEEKIGTIVHICGQMRSVYKQVNMIKSDALSFDSVVSMKSARENLPDRILMGNVSTYALEFGTPEKISSLTNKCIKDGSNIISPACGLGTKSPLENIQAILATLKKEETEVNA